MTSGYSQTWLSGQHWDHITNSHLEYPLNRVLYFTLCLNGTRYYDNRLSGIHSGRFDCIQTSATQHDELRDSRRAYYCDGLCSKTVHTVTSAPCNCTCLYGEVLPATLPTVNYSYSAYCWHYYSADYEYILWPTTLPKWNKNIIFSAVLLLDGSVAKWLACWTQAQKGLVQIAAATLSGNSLRQTVHTHHASVHQGNCGPGGK